MSALPVVDPSAPELTRQQRRERTARAFASAAATRSPSRREQLEDYAIQLNMDVARSVASRYFDRGIEQEDLLQVAYAALTRAARDFDPSRHLDFSRTPCRPSGARSRSTSATAAGRSGHPAGSRSCRAGSREHKAPWPSVSAGHPGPQRSPRSSTPMLGDVVEAMSADGCFTPSSLDQPVPNGEDGRATSVCDLLGRERRLSAGRRGPRDTRPRRPTTQGTGSPDPLHAILRGVHPTGDR